MGEEGTLLLGIDAGGTTVRVVLADAAGQIAGAGQSGGANPVALPFAEVAAHVSAAVQGALAGRDLARAGLAVLGVAGISRLGPGMAARLRRASGLRCPVHLVADPVVAFTAGTAEPRGTVLVAGTGTIAATIDEGRMVRRVDGNGWLAGDDGSGFWLGREAVRAVLAQLDGRGPPTRLRRPVFSALTGRDRLPSGTEQQRELLAGAVYDGPPVRLATLAPLVSAAAEAGDRVAGLIVAEAVRLLAGTADVLLGGQPAGPLVLAGGLLTAEGPVRREVTRQLTGRYGRELLTAGDSAGAAAWLAARMLGLDPDTAVHQRLVWPSAPSAPSAPAGPAG